jgi:hypothetical protein
MCDVPLRHLRNVDRLQRELRASKQLHSLCDVVAACGYGIDILRPRIAGMILRHARDVHGRSVDRIIEELF